jgi:putative hydrolase of the HAD superfamily
MSSMQSADPIRAVLVDVDGTLYHQTPVRALMAAEIAIYTVRHPDAGRELIRILQTFRRVREGLRPLGRTAAPLNDLQFDETARRAGVRRTAVQQAVDEWIFRRPLKYLARARRRDVIAVLTRLHEQRIPLGVLSDYPADAKLRAMGVADLFSRVVCTTEPPINAFKPHPRGFLHACSLLGCDAARVVYIGDRADVDAAGARAAGMTCCLVGRRAGRRTRSDNRRERSNGSRRIEDLEQICLTAV